MTKVITRKRVNITLPKDTISLIDQVAKKGDRSRFLDEAVRFYVKETGRANLRKLLRDGAIQRAERDLNLTREWFHLEYHAWPKGKRT
jgi:CopG family transcriptional regulator/antitoxin EndoAI